MKRVVKNKELKEKMLEAINLLCNTVKTTLGPKGSNAIINNSSFSPFITNDGVTIAENIESEDVVVNTILQIAKESSIKTNELVGDGTTTTLVLLQSIFENGLKIIEEGINPIILKNELNCSVKNIEKMIKEKTRIPTDDELKKIAIVSANDQTIGKNVSEAFLKVRNKSAITIKEGKNVNTCVNYFNGYIFDSILASKYFLKDLKEVEYNKSNILLIDNFLDNLNDISEIINEIILRNERLVILARDYNEFLINDIVSLNMDNNANIVLLKNPLYGVKQISALKDIASISKAKIIEKLDYVSLNDLGIVDNIKITNEEVVISFKINDEVNKRLIDIRKELDNSIDDMDLEFINKRIAMFSTGLVEIVVGGFTTTERREKKMRYDDALWAISTASDGVLPGMGLILLEISKKMDIITNGDKLLKQALLKPFEQIMVNAGINKIDVLRKIEESNYQKLYNVTLDRFENINNTEILDSSGVVINSLGSAVSITGLLLTTTSIIVNEQTNNLNKINDYNEL